MIVEVAHAAKGKEKFGDSSKKTRVKYIPHIGNNTYIAIYPSYRLGNVLKIKEGGPLCQSCSSTHGNRV